MSPCRSAGSSVETGSPAASHAAYPPSSTRTSGDADPAQHPPGPRGGIRLLAVVDDDAAVLGDPGPAQQGLDDGGVGQRVAPAVAGRSGELGVEVDEERAGHVAGVVVLPPRGRVRRRQRPADVEHDDVLDLVGELGGGDEVGHRAIVASSPCACSPGPRARVAPVEQPSGHRRCRSCATTSTSRSSTCPATAPRAAEEFTLARCVEVIDEAVRAVPAGAPVVLVGHSLGGYAAMAYAAARPGCSRRARPRRRQRHAHRTRAPRVYRGVAALTDRLGPERMTRVNDRVLHRLYPAERIDPVIAGGYYFAPTAAAWREVMTHCRPVDARARALPGAAAQRPVRPAADRGPGLPARLPQRPGRDRPTGRATWPTSTSRRPSPRPLLRFARRVADSAPRA